MLSNSVKKILILAANPQDTDQLWLGKEVRQIEEALQLLKKRDYFKVKSEWAVTKKNFKAGVAESRASDSPFFWSWRWGVGLNTGR